MKPVPFRILILLCAAGVLLPAQPQTFHTVSASGPGIGVPGFLPPAPPQMDPVAYWAAYFGLDSAQQASLKTILSDQQDSLDSLKANLTQAHSTLRAAAKAGTSDADIDNLAANLGALYAQAVSAQAKAYARFYALLTADQKRKLDNLTDSPDGLVVGAFRVISSAGPSGASSNQ
jgi:Spy/CpxP family protein refolding chaperone